MFSNYPTHASIASFCILLSITTGTAMAASDCVPVTELGPSTTWRGPAETKYFRLQLPATGILSVELHSTSQHPATIAPSTPTCGGPLAKAVVFERSATHLVLSAHTVGNLFFEVAAEGTDLKLVTEFHAAQIIEEVFDRDDLRVVQTSFIANGFAFKADPEDVEPDADGQLAAGSGLLASFLTLWEIPFRKADPEDVEPDADGLIAFADGPLLRQLLFYDPICPRTGSDDHGDTMGCATSLDMDKGVRGEIFNAQGDDQDVFRLELSEMMSVEITLAGEVTGTLLDQAGQQLATHHLPGDGGGEFRVLSTLVPGRYYFRLGGRGSYEITATARNG